MQYRWITVLAILHARVAFAVITTSIDLLDPSDGVSMPPPGVVCFDVIVDAENVPGRAWTAGGIFGVVTPVGQQFGVSLRYGPGDDPNTPRSEQLFNPGLENRFVTFLTKPRPRDGDIRYTNAGAGIAGPYFAGGRPIEAASSFEIDAAWFANPPEGPTSPGVDGCVARIAFNIPDSLPIGYGTQIPPDVIVLFASAMPGGGSAGTVSASFDQPTITGIDWYVWTNVPEPASLVPLLSAMLMANRRRKLIAPPSAANHESVKPPKMPQIP